MSSLDADSLNVARLARFYGWTEPEIEGMKYSRVMVFLEAIPILQREENRRALDFISFPHMKQEVQRSIIERHLTGGKPVLDGRAMAAKYSRYVKRKDQPWPKALSKS